MRGRGKGLVPVMVAVMVAMTLAAAVAQATTAPGMTHTGTTLADYGPVADWQVLSEGDGTGTMVDAVAGGTASVSRASVKTALGDDLRLHLVPAGTLAAEPWSAYRTGGTGYAALIEGARTNYLLNGHFDADTNADGLSESWMMITEGNATATLGRNTDDPIFGTVQSVAAARNPGSPASWPSFVQNTAPGTMSQGDRVVASVWYRNLTVSGDNPVTLDVRGYTDELASQNQASVALVAGAAGEWKRAYVLTTLTEATVSRASARIQHEQDTDGDAFSVEIGAFQLEKVPAGVATPSSYVPTTDAVATRAADVVTVPTTGWNAAVGSLVVVTHRTALSPDGVLVTAEGAWGEAIRLRASTGLAYAEVSADGFTAAGSKPVAAYGASTMGMAWAAGSPGTVTPYATGVAGDASPLLAVPALPETAAVGRSPAAGLPADGPIQRIVVYDEQLTPEQMARLDRLVVGLTPDGTAAPIGTTNSVDLLWDRTGDGNGDGSARYYLRQEGSPYGEAVAMVGGPLAYTARASRLLPGVTYGVYMEALDPDGLNGSPETTVVESSVTTFTVPTNPILIGTPSFSPKPTAATVWLPFSSDSDDDSSADMLVSSDGGETWSRHAMSRDGNARRFVASVTGLAPDASHLVSFEVDDPDGTAGTSPEDRFPFRTMEPWVLRPLGTVRAGDGTEGQVPLAPEHYWWRSPTGSVRPLVLDILPNNADGILDLDGTWRFRPLAFTDSRGVPGTFGADEATLEVGGGPAGGPDAEGWYGPFPATAGLALGLRSAGTYAYELELTATGHYLDGEAFSLPVLAETYEATTVFPNASRRTP